MTQEDKLLAYFKQGKILTKSIADKELGIKNLPNKLFNLRDEGFNIDKEMKIDETTGKKIAHYFLAEGRAWTGGIGNEKI